MATVSIYDSFAHVFPELVRGLVEGQHTPQPSAPRAATLRIDVIESREGFTVYADLPGVTKEDIQIDVEGHSVSLRASLRREPLPREGVREGVRVLCAERQSGVLARSFTLGAELDAARAQAHFENGVLELNLPRKETAATRRVAIS